MCGLGTMTRFLIAGLTAFGFAYSGLALAQSTGNEAGTAVNGSMVHSPAVNVDSGINAKGSTTQQSPAADNNGTPVKLPPPSNSGAKSSQTNTPGSSSNALTASPKGPGTGGTDATK
jgi:hypothetical protein